jgi:anaerobic magnesium-protoporphyrin IX monomethyl ester cyclase
MEIKRMTNSPIRAILIQPPNLGGVRPLICHMDEKSESIGFKPPLGLLSIATFLKEKTAHNMFVLDAWAQRLNFDQCLREVLVYQPDVVGISAWTDWWYAAYHLGKLIKAALPSVHLCYGGPHVAIYPEETLSLDYVDSVIAGDGEEPFAYLCDMFSNGAISNDIPGLHFKQYGVKNGEARFSVQKDPDSLPIPDRTLLPLQYYTSVFSPSDFITTMVTSRGCPYQCIYCKLNFQNILVRSASSVVEEFKRIYDLGIREVEVYDDTFTLSRTRVMEICRGLIEQKIKLSWAVRDRVNMADKELLEQMKAAGCIRIHYGIESGVDRILSLMQKNITIAQARSAIKLAKEMDFTVLAYFMLGNKGETKEDINRTIDFAFELDADYAGFSIAVPYPGTQMYAEALSNGIIKYDYWKGFALRPEVNFCVPGVYEENLTLAELIELRNKAIRRYYLRPKYIFKEMIKVKSGSEFKRKATMALRLFRSSIFRNAGV